MRVKLAEVGSELPLRYAVPFIGIIYAIGLYGFYQVCPAGSACGAGEEPYTFFNNALRTFGLFFSLAEPGHEALRNVPLMIARWIAPSITVFAIFRVFAERFDAWRRERNLARMKGHQVVIGLGESARHLVASPDAMVIVDREPSALVVAVMSNRHFTVAGDGRDAAHLIAAQVGKAKELLIMGGSDSENLEMLGQISKLREDSSEKLRVAVRLKTSGLMEQLNCEDSFVGTAHLDVFAFTLDQVAAHQFIAAYSFSEMADLRGQARAHLLVIGWSEFALDAVVQFLRISPFGTLAAPRISLLCENSEAVRAAILQTYPIFSSRNFVQLDVYELNHAATDQQLSRLESLDALTAILIAYDSDERNAVTALKLRQQTRMAHVCFAPIFVRLKSALALEQMLLEKTKSPIDPAQAIIAVGQIHKSLSFENLFGFRESLAKPFHDAYRADMKGTAAATADWSNLPATYRNANIAAADHSAARIVSAGYVITRRPGLPHGTWHVAEPSAEMEQLAEIIHRAWDIDRRLDGWTFGKVRDNAKLLHPNLVPYAQLSEAVKEHDRAQIRLLEDVLKQGTSATTVFKDTVVAALGHNHISADEANDIADETKTAMLTLGAAHVTLASPLAPGSDSVIVDAALDFLIAQKIPYRLLILQALPWSIVRGEFIKVHGRDASGLDMQREAILTKAGRAAHIVHLEPASLTDEDWAKDAKLRVGAYRCANDWMAKNALHVLCHLRDGQKVLPGGTAEALVAIQKHKAVIHRV